MKLNEKTVKKFPLWWIVMVVVTYVIDQATKLWAESRFLNELGLPNFENINVIGTYFRFNLAYNLGSAFSIKPQKLVPFLSPTVFYTILSIVAIYGLYTYYRSLDLRDWMSRAGVGLIFSGAIGNLSDRFRIGKVVDFIDWEFPDITFGSYHLTRWPTFNMADSWVLIGIAFLILSPWIYKELHPEKNPKKTDQTKAVKNG